MLTLMRFCGIHLKVTSLQNPNLLFYIVSSKIVLYPATSSRDQAVKAYAPTEMQYVENVDQCTIFNWY